jgi:poly(A) polymerase
VPDPVVIPRADHPISRRDIDPDALRVIHRLQQAGYVAYLVGGSVRDLILGRRPKDFDIGTSAHPYQIKKLFRNCWIIGRRFRLAHIKFGDKTIEVATFRKNVPDAGAEPAAEAETEAAAGAESVVVASAGPADALPHRWAPADHHVSGGDDLLAEGEAGGHDHARRDGRSRRQADPHGIVHRDNTFGTPEEDAFRRDFTINALFYDASTKSVIDYVGGLGDLERRLIRSIGDPRVRFVEDPVRMFRAAVLGARLGCDMDALVIEAIAELRPLITKASPARMLEEYFKILRSGHAEASFRALARVRLLELITPELKSPPDALWDALAQLDRYRQRFPSAPPELTNAILIGTLLHPIGALNVLTRRVPDRGAGDTEEWEHPDRIAFGALPVARKDVERLRHVLQSLPRLSDPDLPPRVARGLPHRPSFADTLTWYEIFGGDADVVERWRHAMRERAHERRPQGHAAHGAGHGHAAGHGHGHGPGRGAGEGHGHAHGHGGAHGDGQPRRRRRRRRRGRGGPRPPQA